METPLKTYTIKGKNHHILMVFKYDLEGSLMSFIIEEGNLDVKMRNWLFKRGHFPSIESDINAWRGIANLEMLETDPDLSFKMFYNMYGQKLKKVTAERSWERLSKLDRIGAIKGIKSYLNYLRRQNGRVMQANPATYLNQRYWEDDYASL